MHPALVVIDMQKRFIPGSQRLYPVLDEALEIINHVASAFRAHGRPVIWVKDHESIDVEDPDFAVVDALEVEPTDLTVHKIASNAFCEPAFASALEATKADFTLLCGFRAEQCVLATARGAADRDISYALLRDAILSPADDAPRFVERISPLMSYEVAVALAALPLR